MSEKRRQKNGSTRAVVAKREYFAVDLPPSMRVHGERPAKNLRDLSGCKVVDLVGQNAVVVRADKLEVVAERISADGRELERIVFVSLLVRQRAPHRPRRPGKEREDDVGTLLAQLDGRSAADAQKEIQARLGIHLTVEAIRTRRSRARRQTRSRAT